MASLLYYLRTSGGQPVYKDLLAISPWFVAESIAQNAAHAVKDNFRKGRFPDQIKTDRSVSVVSRKFCNRTSAHIYEVFFDNLLLPVTYLALGFYNNTAVALEIGSRDRMTAIHRVSNYPYLDASIVRLMEEFNFSAGDLEWSLRQGS
jgi:hypothetical protein